MKFLNKLERKLGRFAIRDLSAVIIGLYAAGYVLSLISPEILGYLTLEPYYILHGQVWRVITWIIVPPSSLGLFTIIMLFFYFSIGRTLERTWGAFYFNLYIFLGIIFTVCGAMLLYAFYAMQGRHYLFSSLFSTYYINMSIFLAFAVSYPDMEILLYLIIPIKMKWMGILYFVLIAYEFLNSPMPAKVAIAASLLNFIVFFLFTRRNSAYTPKQVKRRADYRKKVNAAAPKMGQTIHRCDICGRTEADSDQLVFRYCSKCQGAHEFCQEHLFTHKHFE